MSESKADFARKMQAERLKESIALFRSSDGWQAWLKARSHFHSYSLRNLILILSQCPYATQVRGYVQWKQDFNRIVNKGTSAIWILGPIFKKDKETGKEELVFFRNLKVFDVSDTRQIEGEDEIPLKPPATEITGDGAGWAMEPLRHFAEKENVGIRITDDGPLGSYDHENRVITLRSDVEGDAAVRVLVHELAHCLADTSGMETDYSTGEVIAESVAWLVCDHLGIDADQSSLPYIASWSELAEEEVLEYATCIDTTARTLEGVLEPLS